MNTVPSISMQQYTLDIPVCDLTLLKSLAKKFGWKAKKVKTISYAESVSPSADNWWNVAENVAMVEKGDSQLRKGQGIALTNDEVKARLGL